jgi:hypothetical protein
VESLRRDNDGFGIPGAAALKREGFFDHAVLNLHYDLDSGQVLFTSLGFNVSPRSYHTLGSMNHLIVFVVAAEDPDVQAAHLARAVGAKLGSAASVEIRGTLVEFERTRGLIELYGPSIRQEGSLPRVVGTSIGVHSLNALKASVDSRWAGKLIEADAARVIVPAAECFGVMIEFVEPDMGAT